MKRITTIIQYLWDFIDVLVTIVASIIVFLILDNYDKVLGFKVYPDNKFFIAFTGIMIPVLVLLLTFLIFFSLKILHKIPSHPKTNNEPLLKKKHLGPIMISIVSFILTAILTNLILIITNSSLRNHLILWALIGLITFFILFASLNYLYHSLLNKSKSTK